MKYSGKELVEMIGRLVEKYHYKSLPEDYSKIMRDLYKESLPTSLKSLGPSDEFIYTSRCSLLSKGFDRIVIGDYGAYIEFSQPACRLIVAPGQEYRQTDRYKNNIKYDWLTPSDGSGIKIYLQKKTVVYADYLPGKYYVSPYDVLFEEDYNDLPF